jgi:hypothetical protein
MRAIRQRTHTNLRVIESYHNSSHPTHTSNIRDTCSTKVESSLPHTMSLTIGVRQDRDRIMLNTGPMTSLTITDHEKRHSSPQHGKDKVDFTRCMNMGYKTGNRSTSSTSDHHQNLEETTCTMSNKAFHQHATILNKKESPTTVPPSE